MSRPHGRVLRVPLRSLALLALLAALTGVTYVPALENDFVNFDDFAFIRDNPDFNPPNWPVIFNYARGPYFGGAFPLTYVLIGIISAFAYDGNTLDPAVFHAASIVFHAACVIVVFLILRLLVKRDIPAAAGAAVFAVHPVQVEAVAWAMNLNTLLSSLLALLALWLYLQYAIAARDQAAAARRRMLLGAATIAFVLAMLARPVVVTLPLLAAALDVGWVRRNWRAVAGPIALWLALAIPFVIATRVMLRPPTAYVPALWLRPLVSLDAVAFYLWKLVFPRELAPDYGRTPRWLVHDGPLLLTWLVPAALATIIWWLGRRTGAWRPAAALMTLFIAAMLPVLGLVPFHYQEFSTVADRYLYLPTLAVAIAIAWLVAARRWAGWIVAAIVIVLAVLSNRQVQVWRSSQTLFAHTLQVNSGSLAAHNAFGGDAIARSDYDTALGHFQTALAAHPGNEAAHSNLANMLMLHGRIGEALQHYEVAAKVRPYAPRIINNYAVALARSGRIDDAVARLQASIENAPPAIGSEMREYANLHVNLAIIFAAVGRLNDAQRHIEEALRLQPGLAEARMVQEEIRHRRATGAATQPAISTRPATAPADR